MADTEKNTKPWKLRPNVKQLKATGAEIMRREIERRQRLGLPIPVEED